MIGLYLYQRILFTEYHFATVKCSVLSIFIDLRNLHCAENVRLYYGLSICRQINPFIH